MWTIHRRHCRVISSANTLRDPPERVTLRLLYVFWSMGDLEDRPSSPARWACSAPWPSPQHAPTRLAPRCALPSASPGAGSPAPRARPATCRDCSRPDLSISGSLQHIRPLDTRSFTPGPLHVTPPGPTSHSSCGETPRREKTNPEHGRSAAGPRTTRWATAERSTRSCPLDPAFHNLLFEPENDMFVPVVSLRSSTRRRQEPPSRQTPVRRLSLHSLFVPACPVCGMRHTCECRTSRACIRASHLHHGTTHLRPHIAPGPSRLHCACNHAAHRAHRSHHRICRLLWCR